MIRRFLTALVLAFVASTAVAQTACPQLFAGGQPPAAANVEVLCHTEYAVGFSAAWLDPAWSAEHLTAKQAREGMSFNRKTGGDFHAEDQLPPAQRVTKGDYTRSGYDRGHMAPAGDFGPSKPESFSMANMVPQAGPLNQRIWAGIEEAVRNLALADGEVYVVTGPLIPLAHASIAGGRIAVPSHTWKAVYEPGRGAGAYLCSNIPTPVCTHESVAQLTVQVGFDPFPAMDPAMKATEMTVPPPTKGGQLAN